MQHASLGAGFAGGGFGFAQGRFGLVIGDGPKMAGAGDRLLAGLGQQKSARVKIEQKSPRVEVGQPRQTALSRGVARFLPFGSLGSDLLQVVVGEPFHPAAAVGQSLLAKQIVAVKRAPPAFTLPFVLFLEFRRKGLVVAAQGREGGIRYPLVDNGGIEHAQERVAALQVVIEEAQGFVGRHGLQPQGHARQFQRQRVQIHAVDAVANDVAQSMAVVVATGRTLGAQLRQMIGQPPGGGKQEVAAAAGRVADGDGQKRGFAVGGGEALADDRLQRGIQQFLHQRVGRVVAAAGLAGIALTLFGVGEVEDMAILRDQGRQFQQTFIDAAQFFRFHVAPVDAGQAFAVAPPGQFVHGLQQRAVAQLRAVQVGALFSGEETAQRR